MMAGVLLFGGVCWFLQRMPDWTPADVDRQSLQLLGRILLLAAIVGLGILLALTSRARSRGSAPATANYAIIGWALGEMIALYGGVVYFLTGTATRWVIGVLFLALTFVLFPARRAA